MKVFYDGKGQTIRKSNGEYTAGNITAKVCYRVMPDGTVKPAPLETRWTWHDPVYFTWNGEVWCKIGLGGSLTWEQLPKAVRMAVLCGV